MSKGQRGNKEARKPKREPTPATPLAPSGVAPALVIVPPLDRKKRR